MRAGSAVRHGGRWRMVRLALVVLALAAAPAAGAVRAVVRGQSASPAQGHAQVIAQGVDRLPEGEVIWRVAYHSARPQGEAPPAERDLGFVVADLGPVVVTDEPDGPRLYLAPGEAVLVHGGTEQRRASTGAQSTAYYALELVAEADAERVGSGIPVFAGPPFAAPDGARDLDLVRDVLAPEETTSIAGASAPMLLLATVGTIRVETDGGDSVPLKIGEAQVFEGEVTITGDGLAESSFVAAVVGGQVEASEPVASPAAAATPVAVPDGSPTAEETGAIAFAVFACPPEASPEEFDPDDCELNAGAVALKITALGMGDQERGAEETTERDGRATWSDLPFGEYLLQADDFGDDFERFFVPGLETLEGAPEDGVADDPDQGYRVPLTDQDPSYRLDVYAFGAADEDGEEGTAATPRARATATARAVATETSTDATDTGSIGFRVLGCPGVTLEIFNPAACAPIVGAYDVALSGGDLAAPLTLADATADDDGVFVWDDLAFGDYTFVQPGLPAGFATFYVPGSASVAFRDDNTGYGVVVDADTPDVRFDVYDLAPAAAPVAPPAPLPAPVVPTPAAAVAEPTAAVPEPTAIPAPVPEPTPDPGPPPTPVPPPVAPVDSDGDGLTDEVEVGTYGTNPGVADSDGDGFGDGAEVRDGTNPLVPNAAAGSASTAPPTAPLAADTDGDGLTDAQEAGIGSNPGVADSDGDGFPDGAEVGAGTSPTDSGSVPVIPQ